MKLGVHYWSFSTPIDQALIPPTLAETARIAEQAGVAAFTVMDHFFQMDAMAPAEELMLAGYTTLGYIGRDLMDDKQVARLYLGARS